MAETMLQPAVCFYLAICLHISLNLKFAPHRQKKTKKKPKYFLSHFYLNNHFRLFIITVLRNIKDYTFIIVDSYFSGYSEHAKFLVSLARIFIINT